jgi:hypothetical protein
MADITGSWEFHRACPAEDMFIGGVDSTGALVGSTINNISIHGNYNAATEAISFNDARQPGDTLYVSFYTGYVMPNSEGGACAMAGTFQEAELIIEGSGLDRNRDIDEAGPGLTVAFPIVHGAWYAIWKQPIIV